MYKIYADDTMIYDSTLDDYKIGKGIVTLEANKSGSFVFSIYPDHFYYDRFVRLKTIIRVYKSNRIIFRGRILNDVTDYWNNKVITCEGELGFLQDSIIRPFAFTGSPRDMFAKFINDHNSQVDDFKKFRIGDVTVVDNNDRITRSNSAYESALSNMHSRLIEDSLGGYFHVTHGADGRDPMPTINYLRDFTRVSPQTVEFGTNLKKYTKTVNAGSIATVIIPLGHELEASGNNEVKPRLTINSVNDGKDYVASEPGMALYGKITKVVTWDDVTIAANLKTKALQYLENAIQQNITIELTAVDLHLLDRSIESFNVCDYVHVVSTPHSFDSTLLCTKQTLDLLNPGNDTLTLGHTYSTFTELSSKVSSSVTNVSNLRVAVNTMSQQLTVITETANDAGQNADTALANYQTISRELGTVTGDLERVASAVTDNARNIATNAASIATLNTTAQEHRAAIATLNTTSQEHSAAIATLNTTVTEHTTNITDIISRLDALEAQGGGTG